MFVLYWELSHSVWMALDIVMCMMVRRSWALACLIAYQHWVRIFYGSDDFISIWFLISDVSKNGHHSFYILQIIDTDAYPIIDIGNVLLEGLRW